MFLLEIKSEEERKKYDQLLVDIINLPYCLSQKAVEEVFNKIKENEFLSTIDYFETLEDTKHIWCAAYRKNQFTLRARTSQRIERLNRTLKSKISANVTLNELFFRLVTLHEEKGNHDFEQAEFEEIRTFHSITESPIMKSIEGVVTKYAYGLTLLNIGRAMGFSSTNKPNMFVLKKEEEEPVYVFKQPNKLLSCDCYFYKTMLIPCMHILACLIRSTDTESNRQYLENVPNLFHERWKFKEQLSDNQLLNFIKEFKLNKQLINASKIHDPKIEKQITIEEEKKEYQNAKEEFESGKLINNNDFSYLVRRKH